MKLTTKLVLDRETKGAVRYQEMNAQGGSISTDADGALIGTLYLRKAKLGSTIPKSLSVVIDGSDK